jgi:hypothetical protein
MKECCLPESLAGYVLARLATLPQATFSEAELRESFGGQFDWARDAGILRYLQLDLDRAAFPCESVHCEGGSRSVSRVADKLIALCNCSASESPIVIDKSALNSWRTDVDRLCQLFRERNELGSESELLSERLICLGNITKQNRMLVVVLALLGIQDLNPHLDVLPQLLTEAYERIVVLCPGFRPRQKQIRQFESKRITLVALDDEDPFNIPPSAFGWPAGSSVGQLTQDEQAELARLELKTSVRVHVTTLPGSRGIVSVNGLGVQLTPSRFRLFMRVLAARFEAEAGWVAIGSLKSGRGLADEGFYTSEGVYQAWARLREPFKAALQDIKATDFLEVDGLGRGRLSTLQSRITWDLEGLKTSDETIRALADRLPPATSKQSAQPS